MEIGAKEEIDKFNLFLKSVENEEQVSILQG